MQTKDQMKKCSRFDYGRFFRKVGALLTGTALLASTNLTTAALANEQGGRGAAFEQFQLNNPGLDNKELKQMFNQEWKGQRNNNVQDVINNIQSTQNVIHNNNNNFQQHIDKNDFASKAEFQAAKQALHLQNKNLSNDINQTVQHTASNQMIKVNQGFSLDLGSAVESITLGDKLFKVQDSVTINVGGQEKTLGAGAKVTAAEYVAAKQALNTGSQTVTLDASGRATGGVVDLDAMTNGNQTMKVNNLVVPVDVVAAGDFSKGGDVRIKGDLINNGSINAFASGNNNVNAIINADNITYSTGAEINSTVSDLTLQANRDFNNYGDINATGNLTVSGGKSLTNAGNISARNSLNVLSPSVTNTGTIASTNGNVTLDTPVAAAMNVNNANGTISALNGAINVRSANYDAAFNTTVTGGDLLSNELNAYTGAGTTDIVVNQLTGTVNTSGTGVHVSANTETLTIGNQCLTGDPTYYNTGNIVLGGSIDVGEALAIIAGGNITTNQTNLLIQARNSGTGQGFDINMVAGANVTAGSGETPGTLPGQPPISGNTTASVSFTGNSASGGNIDLTGATGSLTINSNSTTGNLNGANLTMAAYADGSGNNGRILLNSNSNINASGIGTGNNGNITIVAGGNPGAATNTITLGTVTNNVSSGTGVGTGQVSIANFQPTFSTGSLITFGTAGNITTGNTIGAFGNGTVPVNAGISLTNVISNANGNSVAIRTGLSYTIDDIFAHDITLSSEHDISFPGSFFGSKLVLAARNDISIGNIFLVATRGMALVAGRNVQTASNPFIQTNISSADAGNMTIVAGADYTESASNITILGRSTTGGSVLLSTGGNMNSKVDAGTGSGGDINVIAYADAAGTSGGQVLLPGDGLRTSGLGAGSSNGDITIVADRKGDILFPLLNPAISAGNLNTNENNVGSGTGSIIASASTPNSNVVISKTTTNFAGVTGPGFAGGTLRPESRVVTGSLTTNNAPITILTGQNGTAFSTVNGASFFQVRSLGNIDTTANVFVDRMSFTTPGNVTLGNQFISGTGGILIVAGGNISSVQNPFFQANRTNADAGNVTLIAGANFAESDTDVEVLGRSTSGGSILMPSSGLLEGRVDTGNGSGGDINLIAFADAAGTSGGQVLFPNAQILSSGSGSGSNGNITIVADRKNDDPNPLLNPSINVGTVDTRSNNVGATTGQILLSATTPNSNVFLSKSTDFAGVAGPGFAGGTLRPESRVITGTLTTNNAPITILTGQNGTAFSTVSGASLFRVSSAGDINTISGVFANRISFAAARDILLGNQFITAAGGILMVAGRDIQSSQNPFFNASTTNADAGNISLIAGANFTENASGITILSGSSTGGSLLLNFSGQLEARVTSGNGSGGDLNLIAFADAAGTSGGQVLTSSTLLSDGFGSGANGNITVVAGRVGSTAIQIVGADTRASNVGQGTGNITLRVATPSGPVTLSKLTTDPPGFAGVESPGDFATGTVRAGDIVVGDLTTNGASATVVTGRNASIGNVNVSSNGNAGAINITTNGTSTFNINGAGPNRSGTLIGNAGAVGNGGTVSVTNLGTQGINLSNFAFISQSVTDGNGANLILNADNGTLALPPAGAIAINRSGVGTNRNGGTVSLRGSTITFTPATAPDLDANATGSGLGGTILVETTAIGSTGNLTIGQSAGDFQVSANGANGLIDVRAGGALTVRAGDGGVTAANVNLRSNDPAGALLLNDVVNGATSVTLTATGNGVIGSSSIVSGGLLTINAGTGVTTLNTNVTSVTTATNATVTLFEANNLTLNTGTTGNGVFEVNLGAGGNLTVGGNVTANGGFNLNTVGNTTMSGSGTLISNGQLNLTGAGATGAVNLNTNVATLFVNRGGAVTINETSGIQTLTISSGAFKLVAGGTVDVGLAINVPSTTILSTGPINLGASITSTGGNGIVLISGSDISTTAFGVALNTSVSGGQSGNLFIAAGATFVDNVGLGTVTVSGPSGTGGSIDFVGPDLSSLTLRSNTSGSSGGNATFLAYANSGGGAISLPTGITVDTSGSTLSASSGGFVTAVAGGTGGINIGAVTTSGLATAAGRIDLLSAQPNSGVDVTVGTSAYTAGAFSTGATAAGGDINAGALTADVGGGTGGTVNVTTNGNISTGNVSASGTNGGIINLRSLNRTGTVTISGGTGNLVVQGSSGPGGTLTIDASQYINTGTTGTIFAGGGGGQVLITVNKNTTAQSFKIINAQGGNGLIRLRNLGDGGITTTANLNAGTSNGTIDIDAGFGTTDGLLTIGSTLSATGGGTIQLKGSAIDFTSASPVTLNTGSSSTGQIQLNATVGGITTGGRNFVATSGFLTVNTVGAFSTQLAAAAGGSFTANVNSFNFGSGTSADIITAGLGGTNAGGSVIINTSNFLRVGNITTSNASTGTAGSIAITNTSSPPQFFPIVIGNLTAQGGNTGTNTITVNTVSNALTGGPGAVSIGSVSTLGATGADISITNSGSGGIALNGNITSSSTGAASAANITVDATPGATDGIVQVNGPVTLFAEGSSGQNNGNILVRGSAINVTGGTFTLDSNGAGSTSNNLRNSNLVTTVGGVTTNGRNLDMSSRDNVVLTLANNTVDTTGGAAGGGNVTLQAVTNINAAGVNINAASSNSGFDGGTVLATAGTGGLGGNMSIGTVTTTGNGTGNGGGVTLTIGIGAGTMTNGAIVADGGANGNGGTVQINQRSNAASVLSNISSDGVVDGNVTIVKTFFGGLTTNVITGGQVSITVAGQITLNDVVTGSTSINLNSTGNTIAQTGSGKIVGGDLTLQFLNGAPVLTTNVASLTTNGGTSLTINEDNGIQLRNQDMTTQLTVNAGQTGAGNITTFNDFNVGQLTLSNGNSSSGIILSNNIGGTAGVDLTVVGNGNITQNSGTVTTAVFHSTTGAGIIERAGSTGFRVTNGTNAMSVEADSTTGDSNIESTGTGVVSLAASSGHDLTLTAGSITTTANSTVSNNMTLVTSTLTNSNTLQSTAGIVRVQSASGGLTVDGGAGGFITGGLAPSNNPGFPNPSGVILTAFSGDITIQGIMGINNSDATFNAIGNSIVRDPGADWDSIHNITANTTAIVGSGTLDAINLIINTGGGNGTIINTTGDVNLSSNITFIGQDLAIIASGNIISTGATSISTSNSGGSGGTVYLIAGYNATPSSGGQIQTPDPYTITTAGNGTVSLGTVSINTSATGATGNAGGVIAVASQSSVSLGSITATSVNGTGGTVLIVGETGVGMAGVIDVTGGAGGGDVTLSISQPQIVGGPIVFTDGDIAGGSFAAGASITDGGLVFADITGANNLVLRGAANGFNIVQSSGVANANTLSVIAGPGTTFIGNTALNTLNANSLGNVQLGNETGTLALGTISGASQVLDVTASGTISTGSAINIATVDLTTTAGGNISLGHNVQGNTAVLLSAAGTISQTGGTKVSGGALTVGFGSGPVTLATNVASLTTTASTGTLTVNEDNAIVLNAQGVNNDVRVFTLGAGNISTSAAILTDTLVLNTLTGGGSIILNASVSGNNLVELRAASTGTITQNAGRIFGGQLVVQNNGGSSFLQTAVNSINAIGFSNLQVIEDDGVAFQANMAGGALNIASGQFGAGTLSTNGTVTVGSLILNAQTATSDVTLGNNVVASGNVNLTAADQITTSGAAKVSGNILTTNSGTVTTLATIVNQLTTLGGTTVTITEDNGIQLNGQAVTALDVTAGVAGIGDILAATDLTMNSVKLSNQNGFVILNSIFANTIDLFSSRDIQGNQLVGGTLQISCSDASTSIFLNTAVDQLIAANIAGSLGILEGDGIVVSQVGTVGGLSVLAAINASGNLTTGSNINVGSLSLGTGPNINSDVQLLHNVTATNGLSLSALGGNTITQTGGTLATANALTVTTSGTATLATNVTSINTLGGIGGSLTLNETNGIRIDGQAINSLTVNANGSITTGATASVAGQLTLNAIGATSDIAISNNISGTTGVSLTAGRTITQTGGTTIGGGALTVNFVNGPVNLATNVASITTTGAGGSLTLSEANGIQVRGQTVNSLIVNAGGTITTGATVSVAGQLTLNAIGGTSDIALSNNITGTTGVTLTAGRTITQTGGTKVNGGALSVGFSGSSPTVTLTTNVNSLTATGGSTLIVNEDDGIDVGAINLNSLTVNAGRIATGLLSTTTNISVAGNLVFDMNNGGAIVLNNDVNGTTAITLDAEGGIAQVSGTVSGGLLTVGYISGISTLTTNVAQLSANVTSAGVLYIEEANGIELLNLVGDYLGVTAGMLSAGDLVVTNAQSVGSVFTLVNQDSNSDILINNNIAVNGQLYLTTVGNGNITQSAGTLTSNQIIVQLGNGTFDRTGGVAVQTQGQSGFGPFVDLISTAGNFNIANVGPGALSLLSGGGNSLTATSSTIDIGGSIVMNFTGDVTFNTNNLNLTGATISTTNGIITVVGTGNVTVDGGGSGGTLTSTKFPNGTPGFPNPSGVILAALGTGDLIIEGDLTISRDSTFNAVGNTVVIDTAATVFSNNNITVNANVLQIDGSLTASNVIFNAGIDGTIISTVGDVNLNQDIIANAENFAIVAFGSINGNGFDIDLSDSGDGGTLTMIAGYNASPSTPQIQTPDPYTLGAAATGSINMSGTTINTRGESGVSGNVLAVASNGSITITSIDTGSTSGTAGNVTLIGETGVTVGTINAASAGTSGDVTLSVSTPQLVGVGPFVVTDGDLTGGTFTPNAVASAGNLQFAGITADQVTLQGALGAGDTISQSGGTLTANSLSVQAGAGSTTVTSSALNTLNSDSQGVVTVSGEAGALALGTIAGASQQLSVTTTGTISTTADFSIDSLTLNAGGAGSDIALSNNVGGTTAVTLNAADTITQSAGTISGGALSLTFVNGNPTLSTNVASLTTNAAGRTLTINEANGIQLLGQTLNTLNVNASGNISTGAVISMNTVNLTALGGTGAITLNNNLTGTTAVTLDSSGTLTQTAGKVLHQT